MPYSEGRVVHDADSHVVETPDWLVPYADPEVRVKLGPLFVAAVKPGEETYIDQLRRRHADPEERPQAEAEIMFRKNWSALGSFGTPTSRSSPVRRSARAETPGGPSTLRAPSSSA